MLNIVLLDEGIDARKVLNGVGAEFILMEQRAELTVVLGTRNFTRCVCEFLFEKIVIFVKLSFDLLWLNDLPDIQQF